ncbi:MAG TPA: ABC transporter ATP-binding protein [Bacteroidetes bacterium]|nr:ABC transporter ATP-binding protein [Bacteroidota bacterium]
MIQTQNLTKLYDTDEIETIALNDVDISVKAGEFVSIMGPSGCGKTTLLNLLGMIDQASSGSYMLLGRDVSKLSERKRAVLRKQTIGFVFQNFNLIEELNVYENIELPLLYSKVRSAERKLSVNQLLEQMNLLHRSGHYPQQLSGGQQQRVAVARAVITRPQLILADEPTGNLDTTNGDEVMRLLTDLNEDGTTIVMVTHSARNAEYGHRIIRLLDGKVVAENKLRTYHV